MIMSLKISSLFLLCSFAVQAQLAVTVLPVKFTGQKADVLLVMTNNLADSVASARAVCFLLDDQGKMAGQTTKWVIGGTKDRPSLPPKCGATFNFVITSPHPWATTNLTAKVSLIRVVLDNGKLLDPAKDARIDSQ
jgi:hypothetical protein